MVNFEKTAESFVASIVTILLNAILHYAFYKTTIASVILAKEAVAWASRKILRSDVLPGATILSYMDPALPSPA